MMPMQSKFSEDAPKPAESSNEDVQADGSAASIKRSSILTRWLNSLVGMGLAEPLLRIGTNLLSFLAIGIVIFLMQYFFGQFNEPLTGNSTPLSVTGESAEVLPVSAPLLDVPLVQDISRSAQIHTNIPTRPRNEISKYTVQAGDTVFGIAEKFGLQPQSILWGNYEILLDDPHSLRPGQELIILPVDGVYWQWLGGLSFGSWAEFYGVAAADIIEYPGNHLDAQAFSDYENANIPVETWLIIPNGKRDFVSWSAPLGVTRENPASARVLGEGACDPVSGGAIGYGYYVYPTNKHYLSGFDYSTTTNHLGIDLAGNEGEAVYATDAGVVVYAGWNDYGYGNMIMVDHGNGFQSLYAHLSAFNVGCGQSVGQGEVIGAVGSTGRSSGSHLHFELMAGMKVNPWDYLPPP